VNIPHVTQHDEADITELEASANRRPMQPVKKASRHAGRVPDQGGGVTLKEYPNFNASLSSDGEA